MAMYFADHAIVVSNPEISSVRDSDRILGILASKTKRAEDNLSPVKQHLIVNRYSPSRVKSGEMLNVTDITEILSIPLLGVVPESVSVLKASNIGTPVILDQNSEAGIAYRDCVARFLGENVPHKFINLERKGIMQKIINLGKSFYE